MPPPIRFLVASLREFHANSVPLPRPTANVEVCQEYVFNVLCQAKYEMISDAGRREEVLETLNNWDKDGAFLHLATYQSLSSLSYVSECVAGTLIAHIGTQKLALARRSIIHNQISAYLVSLFGAITGTLGSGVVSFNLLSIEDYPSWSPDGLATMNGIIRLVLASISLGIV